MLAADLEAASPSVRSSIRAMRTLLVDIYPPNLAGAGLATALTDLAQRVAGPGLEVRLDLDTRTSSGSGGRRSGWSTASRRSACATRPSTRRPAPWR